MNFFAREVIWMRTLQWRLYLEGFLSVLCTFSGLYLLRDIISNSSRILRRRSWLVPFL